VGALALCWALPSWASASANDVRVRFTGAMEVFFQPNAQPSIDEIVNIRKQSWDFVWNGTVSQLDSSALGQARVLLASGQQLATFTDRSPCRVPLAYVRGSGPYVTITRREGALDVANIATPWNANYIDSTPSLECFDPAGGFLSGTLAARATWIPAQPLSDPSQSIESQGVQHLTTAVFRFNRATPPVTTPFSFAYTAPPGTQGMDPGLRKVLWVGRVQIVTDPPKRLPSPVDLSALLPGSAGQGAPGSPPPPTGIAAVNGDFLEQIVDEVATDWITGTTRSAVDAAGKRTVTVPMAPPESWAEPGRVFARLCVLARPSKGRKCSALQSVASAGVNVRGTPSRGAGAPATGSPPNPPLVFRTTATAIRAVRTSRYVLVELAFTGDTTRRKLVARRMVTTR
jgi:hypothetical protein